MPNWCNVEMAVYGSSAEVKDFRKKFSRARDRAVKNGTWGTYELYREFGYGKDEILKSEDNGYIRGELLDGETEGVAYGCDYVSFGYETAWSPMNDGIDWLLKNHYKTLKQVYMAEEPGSEIYENTDKMGEIFPTRVEIWDDDKGCLTFESKKEAVDYFRDHYVAEEFKPTITGADDCMAYSDDYLEGIQFHVFC